jgi:transposase
LAWSERFEQSQGCPFGDWFGIGTTTAASPAGRWIAAYAGLALTPWQSGSVNREQGISQSGNPRLRTTMIQLAWLWLRHQPGSTVTLWFKDRMERNGGRRRKTTIVALARSCWSRSGNM